MFSILDSSKRIYWPVEQIRILTRIIEEIEDGKLTKLLNEPTHVQVIFLNVLLGKYSRIEQKFSNFNEMLNFS